MGLFSVSPHETPADIAGAIRDWHRQARLALGNNERFVREERAGFLVLRRRVAEAESALEYLLPDPDRAFDESRMLKVGSRTHAGVVEIAGGRYVLKRYNCRGWPYRVGNAFRRSRAVRAWLVNWQYLVRDLPVPQPLLCLEERRCRLLGRSYILMEFVENAVSLRIRWAHAGESEKLRLGERLGCLLGKMHRLGMLHGDLKWDNLLVGTEPFQETIRLVDLDGSSVASRLDPDRAREDFERFLRDLVKEGGAPLRDSVVQAWERALI